LSRAGRSCFSGGCFAAEEFSMDALPSRSSSLPADALLSRLLRRMLCRLEVYHLWLHINAGDQRVELFCVRFSCLGLSCGGSPHLMFLASFVLWTSLVIHGLLANPLYRLLCRSIGSPA